MSELSLDPELNICALAQPFIETWMREHRGQQARMRDGALQLLQSAERLPQLISKLEKVAHDVANGGLGLHPKTFEALQGRARTRKLSLILGGLSLALGLLLAASAWFEEGLVLEPANVPAPLEPKHGESEHQHRKRPGFGDLCHGLADHRTAGELKTDAADQQAAIGIAAAGNGRGKAVQLQPDFAAQIGQKVEEREPQG